jgi:hypothetical protein
VARKRTTEAQAELDRAVAAVDRELAADLEMMSMFDQTKQAFVLENAQFLRFRAVLEREIPDAYAPVSSLYERIPVTESAMERRGPAGSIRDDDRATIHEWEGDAREAQRTLRGAATAAPPSTWSGIRKKLPSPIARLIERFTGTSG